MEMFAPLDPKFYLAVASDIRRSALWLPSAYRIAVNRIEIGEWNVNDGTSHAKRIKPLDRVIVYVAGSREFGQHFIAELKVTSAIKPLPKERRRLVEGAGMEAHMQSPWAFEFEPVALFAQPLNIRPLISRLAFIKNKQRFSLSLQRGLILLPEHDYDIIVRSAAKQTERGKLRSTVKP